MDRNSEVRKMCLESTGEGNKKEGRHYGVSLAPNCHMLRLNLTGEREIHTEQFRN